MDFWINDHVWFTYIDRTQHGHITELLQIDGKQYAKVCIYERCGGGHITINVNYLHRDEASIEKAAWEKQYPSMKFDPVTRKIVPKKPVKVEEMKKADNWAWINGPES